MSHTEETKKKISESRKGKCVGQDNPMFGKSSPNHGIPMTEEQKKKISKALTGKKLSAEHRKKLSESHMGIPKSPETIEKLRKNASRYWKGRKLPKHVLEIMSISRKGSWTGDKNPNWKGGVTPENESIRHSNEMKAWKKDCLGRDEYTCQKTGKSTRTMQIHHIHNFCEHPDIRFDVDNGIVFTKEAHMEFHKIYGKYGNNFEQVMEFVNG